MRISLRRVSPFARIKLRVSRRNRASCNPENRVKSRHRIKAAIEPENKLVEISLQVFGLDTAMMRSLDPSFKVAENEMDHGQVRLSFVGVAAERQRLMVVSHLGKARVSSPAIGAQDGTERNVVCDKAGKRIGAAVGNDAKPQPSGIDAASVFIAVIRPRSDLYGADDDGLMMRSATFAARLAADHAFINFDGIVTTNGIAFWAHHASAELVEYLEGGLVATETKLALKLDRRLSGRLCRHQVRAPKPSRERRMARLHYGPCRKRRVGFASTTSQHDRRASCETVGLSYQSALRTRKSVRPTDGFKVASASCVIGENPLKLGERSWEAANVHVRDNDISLRLCQATG
jgi:hypothetical protein